MNPIAWMKSRLAHRGDSEHGQAAIRIAVISIILAYALLPSSRAALPPDQYTIVLTIIASGLVNGLGIFAWLLVQPGQSHVRRGPREHSGHLTVAQNRRNQFSL